jgi:hypothetical protein
MLIRRLLRKLVRLAVLSAVASGALALARWALGRLAGEPGVPVPPTGNGSGSRRGLPMSFDSWPPVPEAPHRSSSGA